MAELPDPRKQKFLRYVRKLGDMYGLRDWVFKIGNDEPSDNNALASIFTPNGRKLAWIRLSQAFLDSSPEDQRITILHELTHCHTAMFHLMIESNLAPDKFPIYLALLEYSVDGIAHAIADKFPLPE